MSHMIENTVDVPFYMKEANVKCLTSLEVKCVVEFFEFVGESVEDAAIAFDLNVPCCIEDIVRLLHVFKRLGGTYEN